MSVIAVKGGVYAEIDPITGGIELLAASRRLWIPQAGELPEVGIFGDSISQQCGTNTSSAKQFNSYGYITWAKILGGRRFSFKLENNFGVSGDTTTMMLDRISPVVASGISHCVVFAGTNDVVADASLATITTNLKSIYSRLLDAGINVVAVTVLPRSTSMTGNRPKTLAALNTWIRRHCADAGIPVADPWLDFVDPTSSSSVPATGYTSDGIHPSPAGARVIGQSIAAVFASLFAPQPAPVVSAIDAYDAALNASGNLLANPGFLGTGGTVATGFTGTLPDSWTSARGSGTGTLTVAAQNRTDGKQGREVVLTAALSGVSNNEDFQVRQEVLASGGAYAPLDVLVLECSIDVSGVANCKYIQIGLLDNDGVTTRTAFDMANTSQNMPEANWSGVIRSPRLTIASYAGSGTQKLTARIQLGFDGTTSGTATVKIRDVRLSKI